MKFARIALAALALGLIVEPVIVHHSDVAYSAAKKKKTGRTYTKAQRAEIHKRATVICRKQYHTTTQVQVIYKQNGQISIMCWGN